MSKIIQQHSDATVLAIISEPTPGDAARLAATHGIHKSLAQRWHKLVDRRALRLAIEHDIRGAKTRWKTRPFTDQGPLKGKMVNS